jgi:hypothetical protein
MIYDYLNEGITISLSELNARLASHPEESIQPLDACSLPVSTPDIHAVKARPVINLGVPGDLVGAGSAPIARSVASALLSMGLNPAVYNGGHSIEIGSSKQEKEKEKGEEKGGSGDRQQSWDVTSSHSPSSPGVTAATAAAAAAAAALRPTGDCDHVPPSSSASELCGDFCSAPYMKNLEHRSISIRVGSWVRVTSISPHYGGRIGTVLSLPATYTTHLDVCVDPRASGVVVDQITFCPPDIIRDVTRYDGILRTQFQRLGWPASLFDRADKNSDGVLLHHELRAACETIAPDQFEFLLPFLLL